MGQQNLIKRILLIVLFAFLCLPLVEHYTHILPDKKLGGYAPDVPNIGFKWKYWWSDSFQKQKNDYVANSFGLRPYFIRISNQVDFSLFKKLHAQNIVVGPTDNFYEETYINEYCGTSVHNTDDIRTKLIKLKAIQDTLEKLGKVMVFVYAPSKAYYYPNDFPKNMQCKCGDNTDYKKFRRISDSLGIHQIDCNGWYMKIKDTAKGLLMSKEGIHWTSYGALKAADSLTKYLKYRMHVDMPGVVWTNDRTIMPNGQDRDMVKALNLLFPVEHEDMTIPGSHFTEDTAQVKPRIIYLGDSFLWTFVYTGVMQHISSNWQFWYYFNEVWDEKAINGAGQKQMSGFDWQQSLLHSDCLVILYTEPNLASLGNGFIEKAYDYFYPSKH